MSGRVIILIYFPLFVRKSELSRGFQINLSPASKPMKQKNNPSPSLVRQPSALVASLPFVVLLLAYVPALLDASLMPKYVGVLLFVGLGVSWLVIQNGFADFSKHLKTTVFYPVYGVYLLVCLLSLVNARLWGDGLFEWSKLLLGAAFTAILTFHYRQRQALFFEHLSKILTIFLLASCGLALAQLLPLALDGKLQHDKLYQISALFSHRNILSEILLMCLPFAGIAVLYLEGSWKKAAWVALGLGFVLMVGLLSRAVWIAFVAAVLATTLYYLLTEFVLSRQADKAERLRFLKGLGGIVLLFVLLLCLYGFVYSFDTLSKTFHSLIDPSSPANLDRLTKWQQTWQLSRENILLGTGMGDWKIDILQFPAVWGSQTEYGKLLFQRPHNDYLWILSESGILALLAYLALWGLSFVRLHQQIGSAEGKDKWKFYLLFAGLLGYMVFSFFSFPKERIEEVILLHTFFAGVWLSSANEKVGLSAAYNKPPILFYAIWGICCCLFLYISSIRIKGELEIRQVQLNNQRQNYAQSLIHAQKAYQKPFFEIDPISTPVYFYTGASLLQLGKPAEALPYLEEANEIAPNHVQVLNNLAGTYYQLNRQTLADSLYRKAVWLAPKYEDALLSLCAINAKKQTMEGYEKAFEYLCAIDTASTHPKYPSFMRLTAQTLCDKLKPDMPDSLFHARLCNALHQKKAAKLAYQHVQGKNRTFMTQLKAETLYQLYAEKRIDSLQWEEWKQKYACGIVE